MPVDFTRESVKPLRYASLLAVAHGGKIILLHVTKPIRFCVDCGYGPVNREIPDEAQTHRDRLRLRRFVLKHLQENLLEDIVIRSGEVIEEIIRAALDKKADLIVLCAHDETGAGSIRSHETVERVTRFAPCPVLVVRGHERDFVASRRSRYPDVSRTLPLRRASEELCARAGKYRPFIGKCSEEVERGG